MEKNRQFIKFLIENYKSRINFTFGTFFLNLTRSYLDNKFLLVYIHQGEAQHSKTQNKVLEMLFGQQEIASFVNKHCVSYGMFDNSDDYEIVQKYAALRDLPAFALFKMDKKQKS